MAAKYDLLANRYHFLAAIAATNPIVLQSLREEVACQLEDSPGDLKLVECKEFEITRLRWIKLERQIARSRGARTSLLLDIFRSIHVREVLQTYLASEGVSLDSALANPRIRVKARRAVEKIKKLLDDVPPAAPFIHAERLAAWASKFSLNDAWIIDCAAETLAMWRQPESPRGNWAFRVGEDAYRTRWICRNLRSVAHSLEAKNSPNHGHSDSCLLNQVDRVREHLMALEFNGDYLFSDVQEICGFHPGFFALAMFQTKGMSPREISDVLGQQFGYTGVSGDKGIFVACARAAKMIGLTLRERRRRPKGVA